jgi:hypothetical protein
MALSSTEAEYVALCQVAKESVWMIEFLGDLGVLIHDAMVVHVDNQGAIALAKNSVFHDRSKHIDIQYHYTRGLVKERRIHLEYIPTTEMLADLLTKPLPRRQHGYLADGIGLVGPGPLSSGSLDSLRGGVSATLWPVRPVHGSTHTDGRMDSSILLFRALTVEQSIVRYK